MADLKTYSVLIAWDDDDEEQGEYGEIVRATDAEDAERKARASMRENHISNHCDPDDDEEEIAESCASYESEDHRGETIFGGRVIDLHEGAIWKAKELEAALRDMQTAYGRLHDFLSDAIEGGRLKEADIPDDYAAVVETLAGPCNAANDKAKAIIAEIDAL